MKDIIPNNHKKFTILVDDNIGIVNALKESKTVDTSLIPYSPMLYYYDNNDNIIHQSNSEIDYYAIKLMIDTNNLKGYYFTVETEWWDDNDEYQGTNGNKNYKKYHFNCDNEHSLDDFPTGLFNFPFECLLNTPN